MDPRRRIDARHQAREDRATADHMGGTVWMIVFATVLFCLYFGH